MLLHVRRPIRTVAVDRSQLFRFALHEAPSLSVRRSPSPERAIVEASKFFPTPFLIHRGLFPPQRSLQFPFVLLLRALPLNTTQPFIPLDLLVAPRVGPPEANLSQIRFAVFAPTSPQSVFRVTPGSVTLPSPCSSRTTNPSHDSATIGFLRAMAPSPVRLPAQPVYFFSVVARGPPVCSCWSLPQNVDDPDVCVLVRSCRSCGELLPAFLSLRAEFMKSLFPIPARILPIAECRFLPESAPFLLTEALSLKCCCRRKLRRPCTARS